MTGDEVKNFKSQYRGTAFLFTPPGAALGQINLLSKAFLAGASAIVCS